MNAYIPPQAIEAEESVLGAIMRNTQSASRAIAIIGNKEESFYREAHQKIYRASIELFSEGEPVDILTVRNRLGEELERVGGSGYLAELTAKVYSPASVESHAREIVEKFMSRELIRTCEETKDKAFEGQNIFELLSEHDSRCFQIRERTTKRGLRHAEKAWDKLKQEIETPAPNGLRGFSTGIRALDELTGGLRRGRQLVIAGNTSRGKSQLAVQFAREALRSGVGVAFFSLEMEDRDLAMRILVAESGIPSHEIEDTLRPEQWQQVWSTIDTAKKWPLWIDDTRTRNTLDIRTELRKIAGRTNLGMVFVDYLQLVQGIGKVETRARELGITSKSLRALWQEFNVHGTLLSQFNREANDTRTPALWMLKESGSIEEDADDAVLLDYPNRRHDPVAEIGNVERVHLILAKQRNGPVGTVETDFYKHLCRFQEPKGELNLQEASERFTKGAF